MNNPGTNTAKFIRLIKHPFKSRIFFLSHLPSAWFSGVRIREIDEIKCVTSVPYKWFSKNPFRSTYFACLSMAAELSTGALSMAHLYKRDPAVSMLVVKTEGEYFRKATGRTYFTCEDGQQVRSIIESAVQTGQPRQFRARSIGRDSNGELIAEFYITWSFKVRIT